MTRIFPPDLVSERKEGKTNEKEKREEKKKEKRKRKKGRKEKKRVKAWLNPSP